MNAALADAILVVHAGFVLFVVGGLVATWIGERRETLIAQATFDTAQLVRYTFNGHHTELATLASVVL